jgi:peptide/nickel transport system permease protein
MWRFLADRLMQMIAALLVLSVIVFAVTRLTGDPRTLLISTQASRSDYEELGRELGLDKSYLTQYAIFISKAVRGDLGQSYSSGESVAHILEQKLGASAELALAAIILSWVVGVPLGVIAARKRGRHVDTVVKFVALFGQSMPSFWVGIVLIEIFAVALGWLPAGGRGGFERLILPAVTLSLFGVAGIALLLRSGMLDALDSEFVKLARAKGMSERTVVWKHALRNALLPAVSFAGLYFVNIVTLAIVVEVVFAWPGLGQLTYTSILTRDYPTLQGVVLLAGAIAIVGNSLTDVLYAFVDPRIRHAGA